jgi:hypothetical protein
MSDDFIIELARLYRAVEESIKRDQLGELFNEPNDEDD